MKNRYLRIVLAGVLAMATIVWAGSAAAATTVTVDGHTHGLAGTNIRRTTNALVLYTRGGKHTGTNRYGAEATVVGGKVTRLADGVGNAYIPRGGFVLSGHGTSRTWLLTYAYVGASVSLGTPAPPPPPPTQPPGGGSGFVTRSGTQLLLDGKPYQFVGYNAFGIQGCEGDPWTRAQMDSYFSELPPNSMTRFWATSLYGTGTLDQIVASAETHHQKLIPVLDNDTNDCVADGAKSRNWYAGGYQNGPFLPWVRTVVSRYASSPAIGMWEPVNEPGAVSGSPYGAVMKAFYEDFARTVRALDTNHLIGTGDDNDAYADGPAGFKLASSAAGIDVLSLHDYASDWGPYWGGDPDPSPIDPIYAQMHAVAQQLDKPIIIGEMNDSGCKISRATRAAQVKESIQDYLGAGAAGVLVWNRSQVYYNFCPSGEDYIIVPGDPLRDVISGWRF